MPSRIAFDIPAGMTNPRRKVQGTSEAWRIELARREGESFGPQPPLPQMNTPDSEESAQTTDKIRENRLRRIAARQGLTLRKSPRRDPHALGYGTYMLADSATRRVVAMDWNLPGGYGLDLEITETGLLHDVEGASRKLRELRTAGMRVAIDDFGTGYSSLGYLKRFPVDIVKVDRSFVAGIGVNAVDEAIVAAVVTLAHAVGMTTIAEGVETVEQLEHLRELGCHGIQGFYFARPAAADDVSALLETQQADARRAGLRVIRDAG